MDLLLCVRRNIMSTARATQWPPGGHQTIWNGLHESGLMGWCPLVDPVLTAWKHRAWLIFAIEYQNYQVHLWHPVPFTQIHPRDRDEKAWSSRGKHYTATNIVQHDWFGGRSDSLGSHILYRQRHHGCHLVLGWKLWTPQTLQWCSGYWVPPAAWQCLASCSKSMQAVSWRMKDLILLTARNAHLNPTEHLWDIMFESSRRHQAAPQIVQELSDVVVQIKISGNLWIQPSVGWSF